MKFTDIGEEQNMRRSIAVISFTRKGFALSLRMREILGKDQTELYTKRESVAQESGEAVCVKGSLRDWCAEIFSSSMAIVFIGASGIAVRTIAPFLVSKKSDPAVLVADEQGKHIISLLSGHLGGGNELTVFLAGALGADPVITTASDINGKLAVDVWAVKNHLVIPDMNLAKRVASEIVEGKQIPFCCDGVIWGEIPEELFYVGSSGEMAWSEQKGIETGEKASCGIFVSVKKTDRKIRVNRLQKCGVDGVPGVAESRLEILHLVPEAVVAGIGCRKGKSWKELGKALDEVLEEYGVDRGSICCLASIDLKKDEPGLWQLAREMGVPFETFPVDELRAVSGDFSASGFVSEITGVDNVCERAALAVLEEKEREKARFLCRKTAKDGITVALLEKYWEVCFE